MPLAKDPQKLEAFKRRISEIKKAHPVRYWLGKRRSPETIEKIRVAKLGSVPWNKGKAVEFSLSTRKKFSERLKKATGENAMHWKGGKPHCLDCGKEVFYASKRCLSCDNTRKHSLRGPLARTWKGGVTSIMLLIRHCQQMREWRKAVFTRDKFTCTNCSGNGLLLHADHHPETFASIIHRYKIKTLEDAMKCEALWNVANGRTLCEDCHREHHGLTKVELKQAA